MSGAGTLRLVFDDDAWDSTISFAPGIPVALGGTLELAFAPGVNAGTQSGRTFDLFDWTGVTPTGAFTVSSPYTWNLTKLYTTGEVSLTGIGAGIAGDFDGDGSVDGADLSDWKGGFGTTTAATHAQGDADGDHDVDGGDFLVWQRQVGSGLPAVGSSDAVPEPATVALFGIALAGLGAASRRRMRRNMVTAENREIDNKSGR